MANRNQNQKQWSDEFNQEVSSIKPDWGTLGQKEKQIPRFTKMELCTNAIR